MYIYIYIHKRIEPFNSGTGRNTQAYVTNRNHLPYVHRHNPLLEFVGPIVGFPVASLRGARPPLAYLAVCLPWVPSGEFWCMYVCMYV